MGRIRTIKPEFWQHEDLSELPAETHLLAAALLNYADDEGYFNANPKLVKAACSPLREDAVRTEESLRSLADAGYVVLGKGSDGRSYGKVANFRKHQKISHPAASKISNLEISWEDSTNPPESSGNPPEDSVNVHGSLHEGSTPEQGTGNREQGTGNGDTSAASAARSYPAEFESAWEKYPKREGGNSKPKALAAWKARIKAGAKSEELEAGVIRYAKHMRTKGKEGTQYVMQTATFFGPSEHWSQSWDVSPAKTAADRLRDSMTDDNGEEPRWLKVAQ